MTLPPSIVYLDSLVEAIRSSDFKDIDRTAKTKYVYSDPKSGRMEAYTDDDILQTLELDRTRLRNLRPSLRHFWLNVMQREAEARLYGFPQTQG